MADQQERPTPPAPPSTSVRVRPMQEEAPRFYQALLDALSDLGEGVAVLDGEGFVFVNDAFCRMTGRGRHELLRPTFSVRALFAPEARDAMEERLRRRLAGEVTDHYEGILRKPDDERVHVEISVRPIRHEGRALRFAVLRDVTSRKTGELELSKAQQALAHSEKLAALGTLVSGVAHELRTPLVYIQNNLNLLRTRFDRLARGETRVEDAVRDMEPLFLTAEEGVDRANLLVKDLARFTRLPAEPAPVDLPSLTREAIHLFRATRPALESEIREQLEPVPLLRADPSKLQQVVLNLLANAADVQPGGGCIHVTTHATPASAVLQVRDDGPGISQERLLHIFDPLYTTKPEGMGLGLGIVKRIVDLHHGTVRVESSPGHGTTFTIHLPLPAAQQA